MTISICLIRTIINITTNTNITIIIITIITTTCAGNMEWTRVKNKGEGGGREVGGRWGVSIKRVLRNVKL